MGQGSVLRPILFNILLNDPFLILKNTEICNFADDITPHTCDTNLDELLMRLEHDTALTDRDLKFNGHMLSICSEANRKLTILSNS